MPHTRLSDSLTTPTVRDSNGSERLLRASGYNPQRGWTSLCLQNHQNKGEQQRAAINRTQNMAAQPDAVAAKLQKQLEYYFSDANLRRDAHLKGLAGWDNDSTLRQWVDLEHVLAFSRARAILDELPTAEGEPAKKRAKTIPAVALDATRASSALELSEDGTKIRRAQPYVAVDACVEINQ